MQVFQATLSHSVSFSGAGVHSGAPAVLAVHPAPAGHGIMFRRSDGAGAGRSIPADARHSLPADLCTVLAADDGACAAARVEMVEHIMAALAAFGVDNALAEVSGKEAPILDGSAALYAEAIEQAGLARQAEKRRYLRIKKAVRVLSESGGYAEFLPEEGGFAARFAVMIDFPSCVIGRQELEFTLSPAYFSEYLASARTFGFLADAEKLRAMGLARGASAENTVIINAEGAVINPEALIAPDAFVRHKALDAVGDTALLGHPFIGLFRSFKGGHKLNFAAVSALLADKSACELIELP